MDGDTDGDTDVDMDDDMDGVGSKAWLARRWHRAADLEFGEDLTLTIEQRITGDEEDVWHVSIDAGRIGFHSGPHPNPNLTLTVPRTTIEAIRRGEQSAQRAFLDGELRVGGDIAALLDSHIQLERLAALLAGPT